MSLPGPVISKGRVGKSRNITFQLDEINRQFLRSKFFHRLTIINVFHLQDLPEDEPEKEPNDSQGTEPSPSDTSGVCHGHSAETKLTGNIEGHLSSLVRNVGPTLPDLTDSDGSPFSQHTMTTLSSTERRGRFSVDINHLDLVRGDEEPDEDDNWVTCLGRRFRDDLYRMLFPALVTKY